MGRVVKLVKPKTWMEYFSDFILQKQVEGARPRTIQDYRYHVYRFFQGLDLEDWEGIQRRVQEYFSGNLSPATINIRRQYLKSFCSYLVSQGALPQNPIVLKRRRDEGRARAIPEEILKKLLTLPNRKTFCGLRDYTLILFQLDTAIRPGEALALLPQHFNLEAREVLVPGGIAKTRVSRTLPISPLVAQWVKRLLQVRPREWGDGVPVFCSQDGKKLLESSWSHTLRKYSRVLGYRVTPYDLRHSAALISLRNGLSPFALQRLLGHSDLTMTKRYLALTEQDLRREHEKATPVNSLAPRRAKRKVE